MRVVRKALSAPSYWIADNAGAEGSVVVDTVAGLPQGQGFNAATREYGDLIAQGVLDPVKVTRSAVQNAGSIAGMLLTTEAAVAEIPEPEETNGHGHSTRSRAFPLKLPPADPGGAQIIAASDQPITGRDYLLSVAARYINVTFLLSARVRINRR